MRKRSTFAYFILFNMSLLLLTSFSFHLSNLTPSKDSIKEKNESSIERLPQPSAGALILNNSLISIDIKNKGWLQGNNTIIYANLSQNYKWLPYFSINDTTIHPISNFILDEAITNLTDFNNYQIAQGMAHHPDYPSINVKYIFELYPNRKFFVALFYINSSLLNSYKTEMFLFNDLDVDGNANGDSGRYTSATQKIFQYDTHYNGWASPVPINNWDLGAPATIESNVQNDTLTGETKLNNRDLALAVKYLNNTMTLGNVWCIPIIYGFGDTESEMNQNTIDIKNEFSNDFMTLDYNITDEVSPTIKARVLNGGRIVGTRNVSLHIDNNVIASQIITLQPGEIREIQFSSLTINSGSHSICVGVNNSANDYDGNDNITKQIDFKLPFKVNIKDFYNVNLQNVNVSLYEKISQQYIRSDITDAFGNVSFDGLQADDYTIKLYANWESMASKLIREINFTYPDIGHFLNIATNITTLEIHVKDVMNNPVQNVLVTLKNNVTKENIFDNNTFLNGNVTFFWLTGNYDIIFNYTKYTQVAFENSVLNFEFKGQSYLEQAVPLTKINLHANASTNESLIGAQIQFYDWLGLPMDYGTYIGFETADGNGNITFLWSSLIDYSVRVIFYSEYKPVQGSPHLLATPIDYAVNFTDVFSYCYETIDVNIGGGGLEDYTTGLVLFTTLPIIYYWEENITLSFMFNVTSTGGGSGVGPHWANTTTITIKNSALITVFQGSAIEILSEIGNYSFILNTSSGYFTSNNPEIYFVTIDAELYGYNHPNPLSFSFNLYNITTTLVITQSAETVIWGDKIIVDAFYYTSIDSKPILNSSFSITWTPVFEKLPFQELGNGYYRFEIDTSLAPTASYMLIINGLKAHFNAQEKKMSITIDRVPTTVNGSTIYDSSHNLYVVNNSFSLQYSFKDSYRDTTIGGITPTYNLRNQQTDEVMLGSLIYNESGYYQFNPNAQTLPIGTYFGIIDFSKENYQSSFAIVVFEIKAIPLKTSVQGKSDSKPIEKISGNYTLTQGESIYLELNLSDLWGDLIDNATVSYTIIGEKINLKGNFTEKGNGIYLLNTTTIDNVGVFTLNITISKANYTVISFQIILNVQYPIILGLPEPYFLIILIGSLSFIGLVIGYNVVKRARIPRFIKRADEIFNAIKSESKDLSIKVANREKILNDKYLYRWKKFELTPPFKPVSEDIRTFINLYQEGTGVVLLADEAISFLEDFSLYTPDEQKGRLKEKKIPENMIPNFLIAIEKYTKSSFTEPEPDQGGK